MNATIDIPFASELPLSTGSAVQSSAVILVATDGSKNSWPAYVAAQLIAEQCRAQVHVLSVLEPVPVIMPTPGSALFPADGEAVVSVEMEKSREHALRTDMVDQLLKLERLAKWSTEIRVGRPATAIARVADERHADLIIVGANAHGMVDRLLGEETATHLARLVKCPLLVAWPSIERLPKRVIVTLDLDPADRSALIRSLEILGSPESLSVLHVMPRAEALGVDWAEFDDEYRADVARAYADLVAALGALPEIHPELVTAHGEVPREIIQFAESAKAEMIVLGVKHRGPVSIAPGGGIAMKVTRSAHCSVLLIPKEH
jgi:nucleotide-binding universal stress UspA family protein